MEVKNLRAYLANFGLTVSDLAELIGCHRCHLSRIASGVHKPSPKLAKKIKEVTRGVIDIKPGPGAGYTKERRAQKKKAGMKALLDTIETNSSTNIKIS